MKIWNVMEAGLFGISAGLRLTTRDFLFYGLGLSGFELGVGCAGVLGCAVARDFASVRCCTWTPKAKKAYATECRPGVLNRSRVPCNCLTRPLIFVGLDLTSTTYIKDSGL